jgi:hypothetical protein
MGKSVARNNAVFLAITVLALGIITIAFSPTFIVEAEAGTKGKKLDYYGSLG